MQELISFLLAYKYLVLFPAAAIEGPIVGIVAGFLTSIDIFKALPAYGLLVLGDVLPDCVLYAVGFYGHKIPFFRKILASERIARHLPLLEKLIFRHGRKTIFFGKLSYGLAIPTLIAAGVVRLPFKTFLKYGVPISLVQTAGVMALGYILGHSYKLAFNYLQYFSIGLTVIVILFMWIYKRISEHAQDKIIELEQEQGK